MDGAAPDLHEPWPEVARQREGYALGMWSFLASEALFFGALFFAYLILRHLNPTGMLAGAQETDLPLGAANTAILLVSSAAIASAERLAAARFLIPARLAVRLTLALGVAFLVVKGVEYHGDFARHLVPGAHFAIEQKGAQIFWAFYWVSTGVHAIHVVAGLLLFGRLLLIGGADGLAARMPSLRATALYWHFVDIVWIFLFPALYLGGRA
jgi:cytochrome c oxidase subunit 3